MAMKILQIKKLWNIDKTGRKFCYFKYYTFVRKQDILKI